MEKRLFGRTGLEISLLTFGCGAVGGLMTKGTSRDQDRAVDWARDNGINHFDTAPSYGDTVSESNLGRALGQNRSDIIVSTKIGFSKDELEDIQGATQKSLEASLKRLRQDYVDIFQLHNTLDDTSAPDSISVHQVINDVLPVFIKLREKGIVRYLGFTAKGKTESLHALVETGEFDSSQVFYNLLTPTAGEEVSSNFPGQDYKQLLNNCERHNMGSIGVRILAGGALSGTETRHPLSMQDVAPIGSGIDYKTDVSRAVHFEALVKEGYAVDLPELAIRYAVSNSNLSTIEVGIATNEELMGAVKSVNCGALSSQALTKIRRIQNNF
tara:strand:- start:67 stop:1047 length:981 start_codon:yes stop_codon:yes gene_type:complete